MGKYFYDFHLHSCLSPCGDNDMTPNNMVNMAVIAGCDIIAITDHNTCKNAAATVAIGEQNGILVIPGMELCTSEEAHVVCLFETVENALAFSEYVYENMPHIKNKAEVFGEQRVLDEQDELVEIEENLLIVSSFIDSGDISELVESYGGVAYPAHIDRDSFSIVASLGVLPEDANFSAIELTRACDYDDFLKIHPEIEGKSVIRSSDAHYLENMLGELSQIELPEKSAKAVIEAIKNGNI
jgi:Predicted metal-dependent phosphoesterases (PHP family)